MTDEITVGPFVFEWDGRWEMYISRGEEMLGMVEGVYEDTWREFLNSLGKEAV